jgi:hypothetical protein
LAAVLLAGWEWCDRPAPASQPPKEGTLQLRLGLGHPPDKVLGEVLGRQIETARLVAATTARQGAALELTYKITWRQEESLVPLIETLNRCEGVQSVEVRGG